MLSLVRTLYLQHRVRVVHCATLERYHRRKTLFFYKRCMFRLRFMLRYRIKHIQFRFVHRLKDLGRFFFYRLRQFVKRAKRSPAKKAIARINKRKLRNAFRRLKHRLVRVRSAVTLQRGAAAYRAGLKAVQYLRYWKRYVQLRKRMVVIRKRFILIPKLKTWLSKTLTTVRDRQALRIMGAKSSRRIKAEYMYLWKLFTVRESRLKMQANLVRAYIVRRRKAGVLYMWLRIIDSRVNHSKYERTKRLHRQHVQKRVFHSWHKTYLLSYLCTWKNAKAALRTWCNTTYWTQRQKQLTQGAIIVHNRNIARKALLDLFYETRRALICHRRKTVRRMKTTVKKYLRWFRRWQWRVSVLKFSSKYHVYPHHKDPVTFSKHRALMKWLR